MRCEKMLNFGRLCLLPWLYVLRVGNFWHFIPLGVITENLGKRARDLSIWAHDGVDISWYDHSKNSAGTLTQQLSTDSRAIKGIAGERSDIGRSDRYFVGFHGSCVLL